MAEDMSSGWSMSRRRASRSLSSWMRALLMADPVVSKPPWIMRVTISWTSWSVTGRPSTSQLSRYEIMSSRGDSRRASIVSWIVRAMTLRSSTTVARTGLSWRRNTVLCSGTENSSQRSTGSPSLCMVVMAGRGSARSWTRSQEPSSMNSSMAWCTKRSMIGTIRSTAAGESMGVEDAPEGEELGRVHLDGNRLLADVLLVGDREALGRGPGDVVARDLLYLLVAGDHPEPAVVVGAGHRTTGPHLGELRPGVGCESRGSGDRNPRRPRGHGRSFVHPPIRLAVPRSRRVY